MKVLGLGKGFKVPMFRLCGRRLRGFCIAENQQCLTGFATSLIQSALA